MRFPTDRASYHPLKTHRIDRLRIQNEVFLGEWRFIPAVPPQYKYMRIPHIAERVEMH